MRCPIRTGSNWLDRLRSTKGYSVSDDLDHFLSNPHVSDTADPSIRDSVSPPPSERQPLNHTQFSASGEQWYGALSNVLSELFNMGEPGQLPKFSGNKIPRKQTNPRIFSSQVVGEEGASAASLGSGNHSSEVKEESVHGEEKIDRKLIGYSRSEVTVIDTSLAGWKLEKVVFRRRNVWKVRDKKGKPGSFVGRKKRKHGGDVALENKKMKVSNSQCQEETLVPSSDEQNPRNIGIEETCIEKPCDLTQVLKMRISFSRSPRKPSMKCIPKSKRSGLKFSKTTRTLQNSVRLNEMDKSTFGTEARLVGK